jgi:hypothetical protein
VLKNGRLGCKRNEILWSSTSDKADGRDVDHGNLGCKVKVMENGG